MAASINDKLKKYKSLFSTTLSTGIGTGTSDTITPATVTGLPTDTAITLTIDRVDASGTATPSKMERIKGVVSSGNIINYVRAVDGTTEQAHTAGAVVEMVWNADDWNNAVDHLLVEHSQLGVHDKTKVVDLTTAQTLTNKTLGSGTVVGAAWSTWSPSYSNITVGSGTVVAKYVQIGKVVHFYWHLTFAADSAIAAANSISLPITASSSIKVDSYIGNAFFLDAGTAAYPGFVRLLSTTTMRGVAFAAGATYATTESITNSIPITWTTNDVISLEGTYEAA